MTKSALLNNLKKETYCRIAPSKLHGVGIIAIKDIPKGTNPFKLSGRNKIKYKTVKLTDDDIKGLDIGVKKMVKDFFAPDEDGDYYLPQNGLNSMDISFYLNHSKNNNIDVIDGGDEYLEFTTNRKIKKGEELTINYMEYV